MFGYFGLLEPYVTSHKILEEDPAAFRGALWLGDYQAALDKVSLLQKGIKTVLSVVSGIDVRYDKRSQIDHHIYFMNDSPNEEISRIFNETFDIIEQGLQKGSVLVHCVMGISRSASVVIAYLMKKFGYSYTYAYNFVKRRRVIICPNYGFSRQLKDYERICQNDSNPATSNETRRARSKTGVKHETVGVKYQNLSFDFDDNRLPQYNLRATKQPRKSSPQCANLPALNILSYKKKLNPNSLDTFLVQGIQQK